MCVERHAGELPASAEELAKLPGIGASTTNAIVSQAQDRPAAVLDGNVRRVLARHALVEDCRVLRRDLPSSRPGDRRLVSARDAPDRLRQGNLRFASNARSDDALLSHARRADPTAPQRPFAIVLGCSDSRVPAELVFDQGLGDLFIIRVAGNIVAASQVGSIEFAATKGEAGAEPGRHRD